MESYMRVMDAMTKSPVVVSPEVSIADCAVLMLKNGVGSLIIKENNILNGIVTEKDILHSMIIKNFDPKKTPIRKIMVSILVTVGPEVDIMDAVKLMTKYNLRRLPVVDKSSKLFGLLTMGDVLRVQPQLFELILDKSRLFASKRMFVDSNCSECKEYNLVRTVNGRMLCQDCERNEKIINYLR